MSDSVPGSTPQAGWEQGIPRVYKGGIYQGVVYPPYLPGRHIQGVHTPTYPPGEHIQGVHTPTYPPGEAYTGCTYLHTHPGRHIPGVYTTQGIPLLGLSPPWVYLSPRVIPTLRYTHCVHLSHPVVYPMVYTFHTLGIP